MSILKQDWSQEQTKITMSSSHRGAFGVHVQKHVALDLEPGSAPVPIQNFYHDCAVEFLFSINHALIECAQVWN